MIPSIATRVEVAKKILDKDYEPPTYREALRDLLADLRHFADEYQIDIHKELDNSYNTYLEEKSNEAD